MGILCVKLFMYAFKDKPLLCVIPMQYVCARLCLCVHTYAHVQYMCVSGCVHLHVLMSTFCMCLMRIMHIMLYGVKGSMHAIYFYSGGLHLCGCHPPLLPASFLLLDVV